MRERDVHLPHHEDGAEIEGHRIVRRDGRAIREARTRAEIDEREPLRLLDDARVLGRDAGSGI
jgi:hypothetical protein